MSYERDGDFYDDDCCDVCGESYDDCECDERDVNDW